LNECQRCDKQKQCAYRELNIGITFYGKSTSKKQEELIVKEIGNGKTGDKVLL
jgi:hypothetical protein